MKRREFILAALVGPFIPLPKPKPFGYWHRPYEVFKDFGYPKMDSFVNDRSRPRDRTSWFWLRPCSEVGCKSHSGLWRHDG